MLGAILAGASALGSIFGGAAGGAAKERGNVNEFNLSQDALRNQQYSTRQSALLNLLQQLQQARQFNAQMGLQAPSARTRQQLLGSIIQNVQPFRVQPPAGVNMGQISGGLSPALLNSAARTGGRELQRQALLALITGSDIPQLPDVNSALAEAPQLSQYKKAGKGESILSGLGLIGSLGGALMGGGGGGGTFNVPGRTPPFNPRGF